MPAPIKILRRTLSIMEKLLERGAGGRVTGAEGLRGSASARGTLPLRSTLGKTLSGLGI
jgi:hypothetical protein